MAEIIRRNAEALVLSSEGSYIYGDALVTVTNVMVSPDMSQAKVYVSVYITEEKAKACRSDDWKVISF
ncbi:hypothetical protein MASR1M65_09800 [Saprospiraceae bacterium]